MLPDRVSNPGPLTYESGALPIALRGPADFLLSKQLRPDETLHYVASHLGLRSLTMSHLWKTRLKWVKVHRSKKK